MVERELLGARVELDPTGAGRERTLRLGERAVAGLDATEGDEQAIRLPRRLEHHVIGRRIAIGLVHREHKSPACVGRGEHRQQFLGRLFHPVGIVAPEMRVRVEQLQARHLLVHQLKPRPHER